MITLVFLLFVVIHTFGNGQLISNISCLSINLYDSFGDGWGDSSLILETPDGDMTMISPDCGYSPLMYEKCAEGDGIYFLTAASSSGKPKNAWEIYWTVDAWAVDFNMTLSEMTFKGGFNSTMALQYIDGLGWRILYWDNLWSGEPEVESCGYNSPNEEITDRCPAPKVNPSHLKGKLDEHRKARPPPPVMKYPFMGPGGKERPGLLWDAKLLHPRKLDQSKVKNMNYFRENIESPDKSSKEMFLNRVVYLNEMKYRRGIERRLLPGDETNFTLDGNFTSWEGNFTDSGPLGGSAIGPSGKTAPRPPEKRDFDDLREKIHHKKHEHINDVSVTRLKVILTDFFGMDYNLGNNSSMESNITMSMNSTMGEGEDGLAVDGMPTLDGFEGVSFQISDESKSKLIAYGSLATGKYEQECSFCFMEGSYYFRISDDRDIMKNNTRWSFCNTEGEAGQELAFHVIDGICYPDVLITLDSMCSMQTYSLITVEGSFAVDGLSSEVFTQTEAYVIAESLSSVVYGWTSDTVEVAVSSINPYGSAMDSSFGLPVAARRELSAFSVDYVFKSTFVTELVYEIDGTNFNLLSDLVDVLRSELLSAIKSGDLLAAMKYIAVEEGVNSFNQVTGVTYRAFELEELSHVGSSSISIVIPDYLYDENMSIDQSEVMGGMGDLYQMSTHKNDEVFLGPNSAAGGVRYVYVADKTSAITFFIVLALGFFSLIGLMARAINVYYPPVLPPADVEKIDIICRDISTPEKIDHLKPDRREERDPELVGEDYDLFPVNVSPSEREPQPANFFRKEIIERRKTTIL